MGDGGVVHVVQHGDDSSQFNYLACEPLMQVQHHLIERLDTDAAGGTNVDRLRALIEEVQYANVRTQEFSGLSNYRVEYPVNVHKGRNLNAQFVQSLSLLLPPLLFAKEIGIVHCYCYLVAYGGQEFHLPMFKHAPFFGDQGE